MKEKQPLLTLANTILIFLCGLVVFIGQLCFWSDSEMWAVTSSYHMFGPLSFQHNHLVKPLFDLYLFVITKLGSVFSFNVMSSARLVFAIQAVVSIYLFCRLSFKISKNKLLASVVALLLLGTSLFWERSFRVRSDLLVLMIYLLLFNLIYSDLWNNKKKWISFILMGVALLVTPKSAVLALTVVFVYYKMLLPKKLLIRNNLVILVLVLVIVATALSFTIFNETALTYFLDSFKPTGRGYSYFSRHRFEHIFRFVSKNLWLLSLFLLPLLSVVKCKSISLDKKYFYFSLSLILLLIIYPNRLPFFIYLLLPFILLALVANPFTQNVFVKINKGYGAKIIVFFAVVSLLYSGLKKSQFIYESHNNIAQKEFQNKICGYLRDFPKATVLDPIGVCPERLNSYYFYLGPFHNNSIHIDSIKILKPDIILNIAKLQYLYPELDGFLSANYFYSETGVFTKFLSLNNPGGKLTQSQLIHKVKAEFGEPTKDFKLIHKNFVGDGGKPITVNNIKNVNPSEFKPLTVKSILTGYELILVSPFSVEKLDLPATMNSLFRHDAEI